jgi:hypothetical protein
MRAGKICARYQIIIARKDFYRMKFKKSDAKRQELAYTSTKDKFHASCHFRAQTFEFICMRLGPCHTWCLRLSTIKHAKKWGKDEHQIAAQDDDYAEQNMYAAINMACLDWKQTYTSHVSGGCKKNYSGKRKPLQLLHPQQLAGRCRHPSIPACQTGKYVSN